MTTDRQSAGPAGEVVLFPLASLPERPRGRADGRRDERGATRLLLPILDA